MSIKSSTTIQTDIKRAKGLGSAHHGAMHKLLHDITTILNIPLVAWAIYTIYSLRNASYDEFTSWFASPFHMVMGILFVAIILKHFAMELQVVYEDYISCKALRLIKIIGMKLFFIALGVTTIISILKIGL